MARSQRPLRLSGSVLLPAAVKEGDSQQSVSAGEPEWLALARRPRFREAVERNAALILADKDRLSPALKWLTNDLGRASTLNRIHQLHALEDRVTVGDLLARARMRNTASDNRILQILRRAEAAGLIAIEDRTGSWAARGLTLRPPMFDLFRDRARAEIDSASLVAPAIRPAMASLQDDGFLTRFMAGFDTFDRMAPALRGPPNPGVRLFLMHDAGLVMLYDLLLRQAPRRPRLLDAAPFSRARLAARFGVSRTHVRRVFAEAAEAGVVSLPSQNRIAFAPGLSEEAERHFAFTFHVIAAAALGAMEAAGEAAAAS